MVLFIDSKLKEQKIIKDSKKLADRESKQLLLNNPLVSIICFYFQYITIINLFIYILIIN